MKKKYKIICAQVLSSSRIRIWIQVCLATEPKPLNNHYVVLCEYLALPRSSFCYILFPLAISSSVAGYMPDSNFFQPTPLLWDLQVSLDLCGQVLLGKHFKFYLLKTDDFPPTTAPNHTSRENWVLCYLSFSQYKALLSLQKNIITLDICLFYNQSIIAWQF